MQDFILDIVSRTIKLHGLDISTGEVTNLHNITWDILSISPSLETVTRCIEESLTPLGRSSGRLKAIGTEAMRRNSALADLVAEACSKLQIDYSTISQELEAEFISRAARRHGISDGYDVVNAGGGSLQIVRLLEQQIRLMGIGITDLNLRFNLNSAPHRREITNCVEWLEAQIKQRPRVIAYTGGERSYLEYFRVPLEPDGHCLYGNFEAFAQEIGQQPNDWLIKHSPFDPKWMTGAVASNCIVLAFMNSSGAEGFLPSDLNIGHGFLSSFYER